VRRAFPSVVAKLFAAGVGAFALLGAVQQTDALTKRTSALDVLVAAFHGAVETAAVLATESVTNADRHAAVVLAERVAAAVLAAKALVMRP